MMALLPQHHAFKNLTLKHCINMKRIKIALNGLLFFLVLNIPCFAQRTTSTQSFNQLRVNNVTISINNMSLTDAVGSNGQL